MDYISTHVHACGAPLWHTQTDHRFMKNIQQRKAIQEREITHVFLCITMELPCRQDKLAIIRLVFGFHPAAGPGICKQCALTRHSFEDKHDRLLICPFCNYRFNTSVWGQSSNLTVKVAFSWRPQYVYGLHRVMEGHANWMTVWMTKGGVAVGGWGDRRSQTMRKLRSV